MWHNTRHQKGQSDIVSSCAGEEEGYQRSHFLSSPLGTLGTHRNVNLINSGIGRQRSQEDLEPKMDWPCQDYVPGPGGEITWVFETPIPGLGWSTDDRSHWPSSPSVLCVGVL